MATSKPIRYVNDGEPLDEKTLNRSSQDVKSNLDDIYSRVDGYDEGTTEAISDRIVLRDNNATSKFGVPSDDQHPWRLNEFREFMFEYFEETDRSNTDPKKILNHDHLPKATEGEPGITKLIQSYKSTDDSNAPSADALGDFYRWMVNGGSPSGEVHRDRLPDATTSSSGIVQLIDSYQNGSVDKAATANALYQLYLLLDQETTALEDAMPDDNQVFTWKNIRTNNPSVDDYGLENQTDYVASGYSVRKVYEKITDFIDGFNNVEVTPRAGAMKLPNGFIIQSGLASTGSDGKKLIQLPIAFPNGTWGAVVSEYSTSTSWSGYQGNSCVPTVFGMDYESSARNPNQPTTVQIPMVAGARMMPGGAYYEEGISFTWFVMGH